MNDLPLIGCALSEDELAARLELAAGLGPAVANVDRAPERARIEFSSDVDEALVERLVAAERECCAFFEFGWDRQAHTLEIAIPEPRFRPTLDALVGALA